MKIYLVRHGQSTWNPAKRIQGSIDYPPLSEEGLKQAELLADYFSKFAINTVYSSPSLRALQTADMIAQKHGLRVIKKTGLRERCFGELEGKFWADIDQENPEIQKMYRANRELPGYVRGAESLTDAGKRFGSTMAEIAEECDGKKQIIVVSHGIVSRLFVAGLLSKSIMDVRYLENGTFAEITYDGDRFRFIGYGNI